MKYPNCKETENIVISQLMLVPEARQDILNNLDSEDFYQSKLRPVFNALKKIVNNGNQVDAGEVWDLLSERDRDKFQSVSEYSKLIDDSAIALNHEPKIEKLKKLSTQRKQLELAYGALKRLQDGKSADELIRELNDLQHDKPANSIPITLEDIYAEKIEERPIAKGILNEDDQTVFYAPGGVGKSLISQDISMALASNQKSLWGKFEIPEPRISLIIQSENGRLPVYQRTRLKCEGNPDYLSDLQNVIFANKNNSIQVAGHVSDRKFRAELIEFAKRAKQEVEANIDIVVWDPLISYHDAEENDNSRMRTTLDHISEVSNQIGATPIVIHHANKEGGLRGATAIFDWARNIIKLEDATYRGEKRIKFTHEKCNNAKMFEPFVLAMDEYLNFSAMEFTETMPKGKRERCLKVKEALELLGGDTKNKAELVKQYKELTGLGSVPTIHRHIDQAVDNEFINRDYYMDGKLKKAEYHIGVKPYHF